MATEHHSATVIAIAAALLLSGCHGAAPQPGSARASADARPTAARGEDVDQEATATTDPKEPPRERVEHAPGPDRAAGVKYDTTVARRVPPRDFLERLAIERGFDLEFIDLLYDADTEAPQFDRAAPAPLRDGLQLAPAMPLLDDQYPFGRAVLDESEEGDRPATRPAGR